MPPTSVVSMAPCTARELPTASSSRVQLISRASPAVMVAVGMGMLSKKSSIMALTNAL
jgi:hypothetical protein